MYYKSGNNRKEFQYDFLFCKQQHTTKEGKKQKRRAKSENEIVFEFRLFCVAAAAAASTPSSFQFSIFNVRIHSLQNKTFQK